MCNLPRWLLQYSYLVEECLPEDRPSADGFKIQDGECKAEFLKLVRRFKLTCNKFEKIKSVRNGIIKCFLLRKCKYVTVNTLM